MNDFVLHGAVLYCENSSSMKEYEDAYVVCENGLCAGVFEELPEKYSDFPVEDYWDKLIIPGLTDLHTHAPQYTFRGLFGDMELLEWLNSATFPEEMQYDDPEYAEAAYDLFTEDLYIGATTRAVIFATKHTDSTLMLMDMLEDTGLVTYVGKVNMDRNTPDGCRETTEESLRETVRWLDCVEERGYERTMPILTPRFTPACSDRLMRELGELSAARALPVQSHLSENLEEIRLVSELCPDSRFYGDTYEKAGLFGSNAPCVMAHCVWSGSEEQDLIKKNGVYIAHCPQSNMRLSSGVAPVSLYLDKGIHVGLGTDCSAGAELSLFSAMRDAVLASNMRWRLSDQNVRKLSFAEVFYMATLGGGSFFGKAGSFLPGYEFDAVVLDDENVQTMHPATPAERAERLMYLLDDRNVVGKYVRGTKLY